jgi:predicted 3-demethylubiquinone-9 3-methyltransferase (glyoxalase superfamily)
MVVSFELDGQTFTALNGGKQDFHFSEAISFVVTCEDQEEVDHFWEALSEGGEEGPCGWLKDRYGVSWQVTPAGMEQMLGDPDQEKAERAMRAMLAMGKIDLAEMRRAFEGG